MPSDLSGKTSDELRALIENHERLGKTDRALYFSALAELNRRRPSMFDFDITLKFLRECAQDRRFVAYGEIAAHYGLMWGAEVRTALIDHLDDLNNWSHGKHRILVSAIVVNESNLEIGTMESQTLDGFVGKAQALGYQVLGAPTDFLREQQERVFTWAQEQR